MRNSRNITPEASNGIYEIALMKNGKIVNVCKNMTETANYIGVTHGTVFNVLDPERMHAVTAGGYELKFIFKPFVKGQAANRI